MKKKALTTVALGVATLAAGMAGNVHADSVKVTKQQIGDETKITTTTTKDVNQQKIAQDKQNISSQQTVVSSAKSSLDKAKASASSAGQVVSSAQSKVNDAKKALDAAKASQPDQIKHQVATDQSQVNTDKQNISSTQSSITTDKNNIAKDQQAINNVGQKAQQAKKDQQKLNSDQEELNNAQHKLNDAQSKVSATQNQISKINGQLTNQIVVTINNDGKLYLKALSEDPSEGQSGEKFENGYSLFDTSAMQQLIKEKTGLDVNSSNVDNLTSEQSDEIEKAINTAISGISVKYSPNVSQDDFQLDPKHLTEEQMTEVNKTVAEFINELRSEIGLAPIKLTEGTIKMGMEVAKNYSKLDDSQLIGGHSKAAYGSAGFDCECAQNGDHWNGNVTMNTLKENAVSFIRALLNFSDGHAQMIMQPDMTYAVYSTDAYGREHLDGITKDYESSVAYVQNGIKDPLNQPAIAIPNSDMSSLLNEKNDLENKLTQQKQQVATIQQNINDLKQQVNNDKAQLQKDSSTGSQQQLQNDQKKLANDQATLQKQQQKLAQDEAQLKADQKKLNESISNAQKALDQAQTNYNNAVKALNDAQSKANASNDELAKAQQNYINALNKLNELKQILENDEKQVTTTSVQWIKNQHPATTSAMGNKVVLHSSSKTNVSSGVSEKKMSAKTTVNNEKKMNAKSAVNSEKKVNVKSAESNEKEANTVHTDTVSAVKLAQADAIHFTSEAPVSSKKAAKKNTLPQMGDENSNKTVWGEISLAMAGVLATLGLADRKRHN